MFWWTLRQLRSKDPAKRKLAVEALKDSRDQRALLFIIAALNDRENTVRRVAAETLGDIGDPGSIEKLIPLLLDSDHFLAEAAKNALEKIDPNWPKSEAARATVPLLTERLKGYVGIKAAEVLGRIGDNRAVEPLIAALNETSFAAEAARALGRIGDSRAVGPLIEHLDRLTGSDEAASALSSIGKPAIPQLILALVDERRFLRGKAKELLDRIDPQWPKSQEAGTAMPTFLAALTHADSEVRSNASEALERIESDWPKSANARALIPSLIETLPTESGVAKTLDRVNPEWRESEAAKALLPKLIDSLNDDDHKISESAAWALGSLRDSRAVETLVLALGVDRLDMKNAVANALGEIGDARAVAPLIRLLSEPDTLFSAESALRRIGNDAAMNAIRGALPQMVTVLAERLWKDGGPIETVVFDNEFDSLQALRKLETLKEDGVEEATPHLVGILGSAERTLLSEDYSRHRWYERQSVAALIIGIAGDESFLQVLDKAKEQINSQFSLAADFRRASARRSSAAATGGATDLFGLSVRPGSVDQADWRFADLVKESINNARKNIEARAAARQALEIRNATAVESA